MIRLARDRLARLVMVLSGRGSLQARPEECAKMPWAQWVRRPTRAAPEVKRVTIGVVRVMLALALGLRRCGE